MGQDLACMGLTEGFGVTMVGSLWTASPEGWFQPILQESLAEVPAGQPNSRADRVEAIFFLQAQYAYEREIDTPF